MTLPAVNACLNAGSGLLLVLGWLFIKRKDVARHRLCMAGAFLCSILFLACYLYYHYQVGSVRYAGPGRGLYLALLASHTILAVAVPPMALRTLFLAWRGRFEEHVWWARRTLPIWLYVSVTGVAVYVVLYRL